MNKFDFGSMPVHGGFLAFYRMVHHSKNFILRDGKHDIIFPTAEAAEKAAGDAFKAYLNSPISGLTDDVPGQFSKARRAAELIFLTPKKPAAERAGE